MEERLYGDRKVLYGVVEKPNDRIEVRVYHSNKSVHRVIKVNSANPRSFIQYDDKHKDSTISAERWLAQIVSDYRTHFASGRVDFVIARETPAMEAARRIEPAGYTERLHPGEHPTGSIGSLSEIGFRKVGECKLDNTLKSGVRFAVYNLKEERVIYAYTLNDKVKYIGVCDTTATTLKGRMERYQGMTGGGTNRRIPERIKECLSQGKVVTIWAWKPEGEVEVKGLKVDLVKGLENPLIQRFQPEWNIKG